MQAKRMRCSQTYSNISAIRRSLHAREDRLIPVRFRDLQFGAHGHPVLLTDLRFVGSQVQLASQEMEVPYSKICNLQSLYRPKPALALSVVHESRKSASSGRNTVVWSNKSSMFKFWGSYWQTSWLIKGSRKPLRYSMSTRVCASGVDEHTKLTELKY